MSVVSFTGGPDGDPISKQGDNTIDLRHDKVKSHTVTAIDQFHLDPSTSPRFAMAYVGTNGRVFNNPIIPNLRGTDNIFADIVGELIVNIAAGVQVLLGQR
jgi:hypothetical protein